MDIPRGEIVVDSPLELVELREVIKKANAKGYLEFLISRNGMEEGYLFFEDESVIGIFYEGERKGKPLRCIEKMTDENPTVILHKLTETQIGVLKEVYSLDKQYAIDDVLVKLKGKTAGKEGDAGGGLGKERKVSKEWEEKVPEFATKGQSTSQMSMKKMTREEFLENVEVYIREILTYVDGKRTIKEISDECGQSVEDVLGVVVPYQETGYLRFKE